ncbi:M10 family metallopeptidase C-terminal domain-containing protein [Methylobacterium sp. Leaf106]|uniref:M10 family metallopeptidase C-terminal domain-containing protein n=1 Tax=Methylobacterium sp. Leaf106 TaxID=1736255 RepID=UPI001FCE08D2|nr:M10 family metallopeptidase C-terminal domain-containing protein [Methylobacterium sp. Leaf106]
MVTIKSSLPLDTHTSAIYSYDDQVSTSHQVETGFRASLSEDIFFDIVGSGFSYEAGPYPVTGVTNGISLHLGDTPLLEIQGLEITAEQALIYREQDAASVRAAILSGDDTITGSNAADLLDGYAGADSLTGKGGDDVYIVDDAGDRVFERPMAGTDRVEASISFSLGKQFIENLTLTGSAAINGTGNTLDNVLLGNDAANKLKGGGGGDILVGGAGKDTLTGGVGNDTFAFQAISDSPIGKTYDTITDFASGQDRIDLSAIQAVTGAEGDQSFTFIGNAALARAGDLHMRVSGSSTFLEGDVDGNGRADFQILLKTIVGDLQASDFIL